MCGPDNLAQKFKSIGQAGTFCLSTAPDCASLLDRLSFNKTMGGEDGVPYHRRPEASVA